MPKDTRKAETPRARTGAAQATTAAERAGKVALLLAAALVLLALTATTLVAQTRQLSLEEAIRIATRNNPNFLSQANDQAPADWQVRQAYGQLLPTANANANLGFQQAGVQRTGTVDLGAQDTDWYTSSYSLSFGWQMNGARLFGVSNARAAARATAAGIRSAEFDLGQQVTLQYMTALRARDAEQVARDQFERAQRNLSIVQTRVETGLAAGTEGRQAEVDLGRAEVALLQAGRLHRAELLRLQEQLGTVIAEADQLELVSGFEIFEPRWTRDELLEQALSAHPSLRAFRARETATTAQVRAARTSYLPTVSVFTSLNGFTQQALNESFVVGRLKQSRESQMSGCQQLNAISAGLSTPLPDFPRDCSRFQFTAEDSIQALRSNSVFPMDFTKNPISVGLQVSIPIFQGFNRQVQVEQAEAQSRDAENQLRAEELRLRTAVTQALDNVESAYRQVQIETRNRELAEQQLEQARQRYAAGSTSILELMDAQTSLSTAERDYLNAVYSFHGSLVQLEAAAGRSLRPGADDDDDGENGAEG